MQYKRFDLKDFAMGTANEDIFKNHYRMYDLSLLKIRTDSLIKGMDNRERKYIKNIWNQFSFFESVDSGKLEKYGSDTLYINNLLAAASKSIQKKTGVKGKFLWMPVRIALTGRMHGPELPRVVEILGKEKCESFIKETLGKQL